MPVAGSYTLEVTALYVSYESTTVTYTVICLDPLVVYLADNTVIEGFVYTDTISVTRNGVSLSMSSMSKIYITGDKPNSMTISSLGIVTYTPINIFSQSLSLIIYVEDNNTPPHSGTYTSTLSVVQHNIPVFTISEVPDSMIYCMIDPTSPNSNCYLLDNISNILPAICTDTCIYSISCNDASISLIGDVVTWNRTAIASANLNDTSEAVTIVITDNYGVSKSSSEFVFTPNFIAVISDLYYSSAYPGIDILTGFTGCLWQREFTITDWTYIYPTSSEIFSSQITAIISGSPSISLDSGILIWYPSTSGTYTLTITYTDPVSIVLTQTYSILIYLISSVSCSTYTQTSIFYTNTIFTLDLNSYCSLVAAPDGSGDYVNTYSGSTMPSLSVLSSGIITWTPTSPSISTFAVKVYSELVYNYASFEFTLIVQEELSMTIGSTSCNYGVELVTQLKRGSGCSNMPMNMLTFTLISSSSVITLSGYGDLVWTFPSGDLSIEVQLALDGTYYKADSITSRFTIVMADDSITLDVAPLSDFLKSVTIGSTWTLTATCAVNIGTIAISSNTLTSITMTLISDSSATFTWTPSYSSHSSELVTITCTSDKNSKVIYNFLVIAEFPSSYTATCTDFTISGERGVLTSGYISWNTELYNFEDYIFTCTSMLGLVCYHYGYYEWLPSDDPGVTSVQVYINGVSSCVISVEYASKPVLSDFSPQYCDGYTSTCDVQLGFTTTGTTPFTYVLNDTSETSIGGNNIVEWNPSDYDTFRYLSISVSNSYGTDSKNIFFCQGVQCRYNPRVFSVTADKNCVTSGNGILCSMYYPTDITITITGIAFGTSPLVYIDGIRISVVTASDTIITAKLLYPNFGYYENLIIYVYNSANAKYSRGYQLISYTFPFTPVISSLDNHYAMEDSGLISVIFLADFLLPNCSCYSGVLEGEFEYNGLTSTCKFSSSDLNVDTQYSLTLCYYSSCSNSITFKVLKDITYSLNATSGHNHGGYTVKLSFSYSGTCVEGNNFLKIGDMVFTNTASCSEDFNFIIPPASSCSTLNLLIQISVNKGISFTSGSSPQYFTYTGCCGSGYYLLDNICEECPLGYYCTSLLDSSSAFFLSPLPCDLGYYTDVTMSTVCAICPLGHQCYCRATENPVECEPGFYCNELGTTKRRNPCPKGRYCPAGSYTVDSTALTGIAPKCDSGTYCIYGIYTNAVSDEKYHAHDCKTGYTCAEGSSNEFGVTECSVSYFCPELGFDTSSYNCAGNLCECPPGYSCPTAQLNRPVECGIGQYQPNSLQVSCIECTAGYYCPDTNGRISMIECPVGSYCPVSATESTLCSLGYYQPNTLQSSCLSCPRGTYQNSMGSISCKTCDKGSMCPSETMSAVLSCTEGYFCLSGVTQLPPSTCMNITDDIEVYPLACPMYYYCTQGSSSAKICKVGTYSSTSCTVTCLDCSEGYMCPGNGQQTICPAGYYCLSNHKYSCPSGYYCFEGTSTGDPNSSSESRPMPCSPGTYCSVQNTDPDPNSDVVGSAQYCSKGTYNGLEGQSSCTACPAGYECSSTGLTKPTICPSGTYREDNIQILNCVSCVEGFYNSNTGSINSTDCIPCDAGIVCVGMGMTSPDSTNSRLCAAGYYCKEGTGSGSSSANPCPVGTYCFEGTKSEDEANLNICPEGRYCAQGTAATTDQVPLCENSSTCEIGSPCSAKFYCPKGTLTMVSCPSWTTSAQGSYQLSQCYRDNTLPDFYSVTILKEEPAISAIRIQPFEYLEITTDFLQYYENAVMPVDYQAVLILTPVSSSRRLTENSIKMLIISNDNYGTKQSIPLPYSQSSLLQSNSLLTIGFSSNIEVDAQFVLQFLNGSYFSIESNLQNTTSASTMSIKTQNTFSFGFAAVINTEVAGIFEDPINYYTAITIDDSSALENPRYFENRFFTSIVTETDSPIWTDYTNLQNTTSIWGNRSVPLVLTYIPYISECSPGYGSYIPINVLFNDLRCTIEKNPTVMEYLSMFNVVNASSCEITMSCLYDLVLTSINREKRWYEASTSDDNSKTTSNDLYPPFYFTRKTISNGDMEKVLAGDIGNIDLIPVVAQRIVTNSWQSGQFPQKVVLSVNYFIKAADENEILSSSLELSDYTQDSAVTGYTFVFKFQHLSWVECFDLHGFTTEEYMVLLIILCLFQSSILFIFFILGYLIKPFTMRLRGLTSSLILLVNCFKGLFLFIIPASIVLVTMMSMLRYIDYFKYITGNFTDKTVITDLNSTKVSLYMSSRAGIIFCVSGLLMIRWGSHLIVPAKAHFGFSYEIQTLQYKEAFELPRKQGYVLGSTISVVILSILLDSLSQLPLFQTYFYCMFPVILIGEYLVKITLLKYFENEIMTLPARIGVKVSIFLMMLNSYKFHLALLLHFTTYLWSFFYSAFIEKYSQKYVFEFVRKLIEKREISENPVKKHNLTYATSELNERSLTMLMVFIAPMITSFIYINYDLYAFKMNLSYFWYFVVYQGFVLSFEPIRESLLNFIRVARDSNYRVPEVFERANLNYRQRLSRWALTHLKIHDENLKIPHIEEEAFMSAWSSQFFFAVSPFAFGVFLVNHATKMWKISTNSPFMDYWLFLIAFGTFVTAMIVKTASIQFAKTFLWKISNLNQLFLIGADGKTITNRAQFIDDAMLRKRIEGVSYEDTNNQYSVYDFAEILMQIIKDNDDPAFIKKLVAKEFKERKIHEKFDQKKIFDEVKNKIDVLNQLKIDERIAKTTEPTMKISLIKAKMLKNSERAPKFPLELVYPWE